MKRRLLAPSLLVGMLGALALAGAALLVPFDVRNSAASGYTQTLDPRRGIAVSGARIPINYPDLHRIDLDLRAYTESVRLDLTLHVRPALPGAQDVRTVPISVATDDVWHRKPDFADPFVKVEFEPIPDSAGQRYDVWIERGPRNRDDVVALWSIKTYSRSNGREVLAAFLDDPPGDAVPGAVRVVLVALLIGSVVALAWLLGAVTTLALAGASAITPGEAVAPAEGRWYTLTRFARRPIRPPPPGARRPSR